MSCTDDEPAFPAKLEPTRDGWPVVPSISQLLELIENPPTLVDGPIVRRAGLRTFDEAQFSAWGDVFDGSDELAIEDDCTWFVGGGGRTALVWPPGARHESGAISLDAGLPAVDGAVLGFRGVTVDARLIRYQVSRAAGEAIEACVGGVSDAPVLVLDAVVVSPHGGVDGPLMFSAPWDSDGSEGAVIAGALELEDDCLFVVVDAGLRYPVLWPHGTTWQPDPAGIITPVGVFVALGADVWGGGGYYTPEGLVGFVDDPDALVMAERCAEGEFREIAVVQGGGIEPR